MSSDQPPPTQPPPGNPYGNPPPGGGTPYGNPPPGGGNPFGNPPPGGGNPYDNPPPGYGGGGGGGPEPLPGMPPLADSGKRVIARIIDIVIVLIPAGLLDWAAGGVNGNDFSYGRSAIGGVFTAGLGFLYEWYMTKSTGQTVGKKLMGLRAAMLSDGGVPTTNAAAVRAAVLWLPAFCCSCFWFLLIGITVAFDKPYKQGLHEKAARTVVVTAV
ncbi:RDD family protein [Streptomyces sp. NPDC021020]|uniref:RDD family protein n=1 Tax=Streptomyces sp. NPDC021020 TaxID=3365109 RepID=UPI0037A61D25